MTLVPVDFSMTIDVSTHMPNLFVVSAAKVSTHMPLARHDRVVKVIYLFRAISTHMPLASHD